MLRTVGGIIELSGTNVNAFYLCFYVAVFFHN